MTTEVRVGSELVQRDATALQRQVGQAGVLRVARHEGQRWRRLAECHHARMQHRLAAGDIEIDDAVAAAGAPRPERATAGGAVREGERQPAFAHAARSAQQGDTAFRQRPEQHTGVPHRLLRIHIGRPRHDGRRRRSGLVQHWGSPN